MMKDSSRINRRNKSPVIWITMAVLLISTQSAAALENAQNVRVGWHEEPYCIMDDSGRRSGYTYEYQQKIAAYTGWNYEYVSGSWADLIGMPSRLLLNMVFTALSNRANNALSKERRWRLLRRRR